MAKAKKAKQQSNFETDISPVKFADGISYRKPLDQTETFFSNVSTIRAGADDISIIFSQQLDRTESSLVAIPQAIVYMTPRHAELLVGLLQRALEARKAATVVNEVSSNSSGKTEEASR